MAAAVDSVLRLARVVEAEREAASQRQRLKVERNAAVWDLYHVERLSALQIEAELRRRLAASGLEDQAKRFAPSHDTIQRIVGTHDSPTPRPTLT